MFEMIIFEMIYNEINRLYKESLMITLLQEQVYFYQEMAILDTIELLKAMEMLKK
jgi:hypothetical protein